MQDARVEIEVIATQQALEHFDPREVTKAEQKLSCVWTTEKAGTVSFFPGHAEHRIGLIKLMGLALELPSQYNQNPADPCLHDEVSQNCCRLAH